MQRACGREGQKCLPGKEHSRTRHSFKTGTIGLKDREPGRNTVAAMFDGLRDGRGQEAGLVELKA